MPTYVFKCEKCQGKFEKVMTVAEREKEANPRCPACGAEQVERVYAAFTAKTSRKS